MSAHKLPSQLETEGSSFNRHFWRALRKHWPVVVGLTAAVSLVVTFYTLREKKIYRSGATLMIDPSPPRPLGKEVQTVVEMGTGSYWGNVEYYETQFRIIQSRRMAEDVVRSMGLNRDGAFLQNLPSGSTALPMETSVEAAADRLRNRIRVEPIKSSRLVTVSVSDADPVRAQRIVTALVGSFIDQNVENVITSTNSATDWLGGQLGKLKDELEKGELALHDYRMEKSLLSVSIDDQTNMLREEMTKFNDALTQVKIRLEHISARREALQKIDETNLMDFPSTDLLEDHFLEGLRSNYASAKRDREALLAQGKGDSHPEVKAAKAMEEANRDALMAQVKNVRGALDNDFVALKSEAAGLFALFETAKRRALDLNMAEIEYKRLLRTKNNTEKLYSMVLDRTKESELTGLMKFNNIRVVDSALIPGTPESPRVGTTIAFGTVCGLLLGLAFAVSRELLDRSIKAPDDIERDLGITFLGLLPIIGSKGSASSYYRRRHRKHGPPLERNAIKTLAELVVHNEPTSGIAEAARAIRTNILFMAPDNPFRRLLVTSAGPAEGKTTVACCIAVAMAQAGQRVLLMDCDLRRPRIHRIFGHSNDVGVTGALLNRSELDSALRATEIPNLTILTSGPIPPNPAELLHSDAFARLLTDLQERFDRIVLDSSPAVPVTDAIVASRLVDGTVVVVRAFQTTRDLARRAVRALRGVDSRIVGSVLNAVDLERRGYDYYQYYSYNRYYGEHGATKEREAAAAPPQNDAQL
jgi:capsular exopolysaccharide synthesis family protein